MIKNSEGNLVINYLFDFCYRKLQIAIENWYRPVGDRPAGHQTF